jgi:magnesium transporter
MAGRSNHSFDTEDVMQTNGANAVVTGLVAKANDPKTLAAHLASCHPADAIEVLNRVTPKAAAEVLMAQTPYTNAEIFNHPGLDAPSKLVTLLPEARAVELLQLLHADRRVDVFRHLSEPQQQNLCGKLPLAMQTALRELLAYPPHRAGGIMTTEFVSLPGETTVAEALHHIRQVAGSKETVYAIYLFDRATKALSGVVSLRELMLADAKSTLTSIAQVRTPVTVTADLDREEVGRLISKYDLLAVPVVDAANHVIGIVTVDDVIDAMVEAATEDAQKAGGMEALDQPYMSMGFWPMIQKRAGWLCVLFLSEMLTATAMQNYATQLEKAVVLTLFIPLIMSSGGNSGSQATSLIIRALALREMKLTDWWRILLREVPAGLTLGAILGVIGFARIALWQKLGLYNYGPHWDLVALSVGFALVGIVTFGSTAGSMLPFILKRAGFDPASASAPFVATLVDVSGLIIYFTIAWIFLRGTLL